MPEMARNCFADTFFCESIQKSLLLCVIDKDDFLVIFIYFPNVCKATKTMTLNFVRKKRR